MTSGDEIEPLGSAFAFLTDEIHFTFVDKDFIPQPSFFDKNHALEQTVMNTHPYS